MPGASVIVGLIERIEASSDTAGLTAGLTGSPSLTSVRMSDGRTASFDGAASSGRHRLLTTLADRGRPAYLKLSSDQLVEDVRVPILARVVALRRLDDGGVRVELDGSPRRFVLQPAHPEFGRIENLLSRSEHEGVLLMVTDGPDELELLDVSEAPDALGTLAPPLADLAATAGFAPPPPVTQVTRQRARELFDLITSRSCAFPPAGECIPFNYPDDGCFARAHQMCRMLDGHGVTAGKVWVYGDLEAKTSNHPRCRFSWTWHVAPFVQVPGASEPSMRVFDPSFFDLPVSLRSWTRIFGDAAATVEVTPATVFMRSRNGQGREENTAGVPPGSTETLEFLLIFRELLADRTPPPPYQVCAI